MLGARTELDMALDRNRRIQEEKSRTKQSFPKNEFQLKLSEISGRLNKVGI